MKCEPQTLKPEEAGSAMGARAGQEGAVLLGKGLSGEAGQGLRAGHPGDA